MFFRQCRGHHVGFHIDEIGDDGPVWQKTLLVRQHPINENVFPLLPECICDESVVTVHDGKRSGAFGFVEIGVVACCARGLFK